MIKAAASGRHVSATRPAALRDLTALARSAANRFNERRGPRAASRDDPNNRGSAERVASWELKATRAICEFRVNEAGPVG